MQKKRKVHGWSTLLPDNTNNEIVTNSVDMLRDAGFDDNYNALFVDGVIGLLNDYADLMGDEIKIEYYLTKKIMKIELKIVIPGEPFDPFSNGSESRERMIERITALNLSTELPEVSYKYSSACNIVKVAVPLSEKRKSILKDPMTMAIVLGIICGIVCLHLPDSIRDIILDDIVSPLQSTILGAVSGIMGPFIFISMTTSITTLDSINDITNLGFKIVRRFVVIILFLIALSIAVSAIFFNSFGTASMSFEGSQLIEMVINVIPTNLIQPFIDGNTPQLVILGLLLGAALLLLGDRVTGLNEILVQVDEWIKTAMKIIMKIVPIIPFLSLVSTIGQGEFSTILKGWEFIAAVYIIFTIACVFKAFKASFVTGIPVRDLWNKLKPIITLSFTTGSNAAPMKLIYEISDEELNIKPEFTSFWTPLCASMLSIKTTIYLITATLMVAEISGLALTNSFLLALIIVTLELSLASPGALSSWVVTFEVFGMSTDYVGLFSMYRMFTENYSTAATMAYSMFEQVEAAYKLNGLKDGTEKPDKKRKRFQFKIGRA